MFHRLKRRLSDVTKEISALVKRRRVPVLLQLNGTECGAACLAMILSYYGRQTRVSECREQCGVGRDGLTAHTIARAARHYGLRVKAYSVQRLDDLRHVQLPAIAHWDFSHFVILEHWSPNQIDIIDPAIGRRTLLLDEFATSFTGVILTFEPGIHFERRSQNTSFAWGSYLAQLLRHSRTWPIVAQVLGASLLLQLFGVALPLFTKVLVDDILPFHLTGIMNYVGFGILILFLAQLLIGYLRSALLLYLQGRLDTQLMLGFFEHILSLPYSFFQQRSSGDLLLRLSSNVTIRELLSSQTISTVLDGTMVIVYLFILLVQAPSFGLIVVALGLIQVIILVGTARKIIRLAQRELQAQAESQGYLVEALSGVATLKASGAEAQSLNYWSDLFFKHLNISLRRSHFSAVIDTLMTTLRLFSPLFLLWVGALYVLEGTMTLGTMLALNTLAVAFLTPLSSLVSTGQQLQLVGAHLERIAEVIEAEPEQPPDADVLAVPQLNGRIELKDVSFRYDPNAPFVLRNISFEIAPGQKVAIVGPTGSGKSTLAKLLLGFYQPTSGEIYYDGIPLSHLDHQGVRRQFGVVLQESFLFNSSIRQNITVSDPAVAMEQVTRAAKQAAIHQEVSRMPMGYETVVAEGGQGLSGGQRQRLSLARALLRRPAILLLDEATSHLDNITESVINQNLNTLDCTRIVIAHRLSTVRDADRILVLDEGRLVEWGTHEDLLSRQGHYALLIHKQRVSAVRQEVQPVAMNGTTPSSKYD